ncbi:NAD(P)/FAD-dependent oxidoreductase [Candidatus Thorarchaeota archaeon]|nr:MAG: NAD(P)/FAD-dependent oxidoreductase [Candidatus Thorarchaeota archaeon]
MFAERREEALSVIHPGWDRYIEDIPSAPIIWLSIEVPMMVHEVVIVGTGPAGLMTAEQSAARGLNTLVLEKRKRVTDSLMGELVTDKALKMLRVKPTSEYVGNKFTAIVGESLDTGANIVVDRSLLGNSYLLDEDRCQELMRDRALSDGAEFRFESRVSSVIEENNAIRGVKYNKTQSARAGLTVGADGSFSRVSATAGFTHPKWLLSYGYRYKLANCKDVDPGTAYFYVGKDVGLGYLWLYPRSESEVNLGIGRVPSSVENWNKLMPMREVLNKYMREHEETSNAKIVGVNGGVVPCAGIIPRFSDAGVALCGNSAGQVSSIVGGGVTTCLHAGRMLATHAKRMADESDYSKKSVKEYEKEYRTSKLAYNITQTGKGMYAVARYSMFNDPISAAEIVLDELDARTLNELIQGTAGVSTYMNLFSNFLPMVMRIGMGYLKAIAVSGP